MPLEDDFCDIITKARRGLGLSREKVSHLTAVSVAELLAWEQGEPVRNRETVHRLAKALQLRPEPLAQIAIDRWEPAPQRLPDGVIAVRGVVGGYGVQGYIVFDEGEAVVIDTAYNAQAMIELLETRGLRLRGICLTHGHADHAEGIDRLLQYQEVPVYLGREDQDLLGWRPRSDLLVAPVDGQVIRVGRRTMTCLLTPGHTPGGVCYQLDDRNEPVCFVGDTLFAGSIGRSTPSTLYAIHRKSVQERVVTLVPNCRLLPGHGPATTVAEERAQNPFITIA